MGISSLNIWAASVGNFSTGDDNYFGSLKYCDTNQLQVFGAQVVYGIAVIKKMNRFALAIMTGSQIDGSNMQWLEAPSHNDDNYFGCSEYYVDTNPVFPPSTTPYVRGAAFYRKGNRVALELYCTDEAGNNASWIKGSQDNDDNYFGRLDNLYADTNPVVLSYPSSCQGVGLWHLGNRFAPYIISGTSGSIPTPE